MPQDIHFVDIDDNTTLFFHVPTLQIYPLQKSNEILDFLRQVQHYGFDSAREICNIEDFEEKYQYVCKTIDNAPASSYHTYDISQVNFSHVVLPIAGHCNLNCPYCFAQTDGGFHFNDYTEKDITDIVDFLVNKNPDIEQPITLIFFGGEPLLRLDIIKFTIRYISERYPNRKFGYSITTNGTILNEDIIQVIHDSNMSVLLSVDGPDNEFNLRKFRNGTKSIDVVLKNIQTLKDNHISIELRATLVNTNPYVLETFRFFEDLQLPFHIVFAYQSENTSHHYADYCDETIENIRQQLREVVEYYRSKVLNGEKVYNKLLGNLHQTLHYRNISNVCCGAGWSFFTILSNGTILPCTHFVNDTHYSIGNIHEQVLDEQKREQFSATDIAHIEGCQNCWAKNLCLGGCVAEKLCQGYSNKMPLDTAACQLKKVLWDFYIELYYHFRNNTPKSAETQENI